MGAAPRSKVNNMSKLYIFCDCAVDFLMQMLYNQLLYESMPFDAKGHTKKGRVGNVAVSR